MKQGNSDVRNFSFMRTSGCLWACCPIFTTWIHVYNPTHVLQVLLYVTVLSVLPKHTNTLDTSCHFESETFQNSDDSPIVQVLCKRPWTSNFRQCYIRTCGDNGELLFWARECHSTTWPWSWDSTHHAWHHFYIAMAIMCSISIRMTVVRE